MQNERELEISLIYQAGGTEIQTIRRNAISNIVSFVFPRGEDLAPRCTRLVDDDFHLYASQKRGPLEEARINRLAL